LVARKLGFEQGAMFHHPAMQSGAQREQSRLSMAAWRGE
jgi:hypothetical protein